MLIKNPRSKFHSSSGVVFLQLAFAIPLILISLFIFIWIATFIHARVVVRDSLQIAVKQGVILGKDTVSYRSGDLVGNLASQIKSFRSVGGDNEFLKFIGFRPDNPSYQTETTYNSILSSASMRNNKPGPFVRITNGIRSVPPEYLYSMALIYEGMRASLGTGNLKYPCAVNELHDSAGCLVCVPIFRRMPGGGLATTSMTAQCLPRNQISIQCSYHASFPVLNTINSLIRGLLGGGGSALMPIIDETIEGYTSNANMLIGNEGELQERSTCPT